MSENIAQTPGQDGAYYYSPEELQAEYDTQNRLRQIPPWLLKLVVNSSPLKFSKPITMTPKELRKEYDTQDQLSERDPWLN